MTTRVHVEPAVLTWACERAGQDADALAARFPKLPGWLGGAEQPTLKQLEAFASATHTAIGYFFLPAPPIERVPLPDFRRIAGAATRPSADLLDTVYLCQQRQEWYRDFARSTGEPTLPLVGSRTTADAVVESADAIRAAIGLDLAQLRKAPTWTDALRLFIRTADDTGVLVMCSGVVGANNRRRLDPDEFRGFALADPLAPVVFVNGADSKAAQMFTLAHELAHVALGATGISDPEAGRIESDDVERWCNAVAAEVLVPLVEMRGVYDPRAPLDEELQRLARRFKVSTLVVLRRMHDAGGLTRAELWEAYAAERARIAALPSRKDGGGDFYLTQGARLSRRFARAVVTSTWEGRSSFTEAFRLLGVKKVETLRSLGTSLGIEV